MSEQSSGETERSISAGTVVRYKDALGELTSTVNETTDDGLLELENGDTIPESRVTDRTLRTGTERPEADP